MALYFSYCPECGFETHNTLEEAKAAAEERLDFFRDYAADGWNEGVGQVCWGEVKEIAVQENRREADPGNLDEADFSFICEYNLRDC